MAADVEMVQGDTLALDFAIVDGAGAAVDLAGATIRWQLARSVRATALIEKAIGSGVTVTDDAGGLFTVMLEPEDTQAITGSFYFEVELIDALGNVSTPCTGRISVLPGLIKPL